MKKFTFGYELKSRQVRRFCTNDMGDVRHALAANAQEYLNYIGICEDEPRLRDEIVRLCAGVVLTVTLFASIHFLKTQPLVQGIALVLHAALLVKVYSIPLFFRPIATCIFESTGQIVTASKSSKPYLARLQGQKLLLFLDGKEWSPLVTLRAELMPCVAAKGKKVAKSSMNAKPISAEMTHHSSKYFSHDGFFYPPALTADLDELLSKVVAAKDSKRK